MATAKTTTAMQDFVALTEDGYRVVREGDELSVSDELVKANPELFEPAKR